MTVLPDQHHFLLLRQRNNGGPIPVIEHKPVNDRTVGKFTFINANVFVQLMRFQNFPGFDRHAIWFLEAYKDYLYHRFAPNHGIAPTQVLPDDRPWKVFPAQASNCRYFEVVVVLSIFRPGEALRLQ